MSPFLLDSEESYQHWRELKLRAYPRCIDELIVPMDDPAALSSAERTALITAIRKTNLVIYRVIGAATTGKSAIQELGRQLGLVNLDSNIGADQDSITSLRVMERGHRQDGGYIPYTDKPLSWHTDGYYNSADKQIRAIIMHCVRPAVQGGLNMYLDHEILYMHLRDAYPAYISALMHPQAMTIPANVETGVEIRAAQSGPVFSLDTRGNLHLRYSARTRNIQWRDDAITRRAVAAMTEILNSDSAYRYAYRLAANEGVITNNVLHNRSGFTDSAEAGAKRLLYRARYYERVVDTDVMIEDGNQHVMAK